MAGLRAVGGSAESEGAPHYDPMHPVFARPATRRAVTLDCDTCSVRGRECGDCVVSLLLGPPSDVLEAAEVEALDVLAAGGLIPPLRLVVDPSKPTR